MQINKNPELFGLFLPFGGTQQLTAPHANEIFEPAGFSGTCREALYHPPGEQQTRGTSHVFIGGVLMVLPRVNINVWAIFGDLCAAGSQLRVHENTS